MTEPHLPAPALRLNS